MGRRRWAQLKRIVPGTVRSTLPTEAGGAARWLPMAIVGIG
jgi:hypothetical protein